MLNKVNNLINDTKSLSLKTYFPNSYKLLNSEHHQLFDRKLIYNKEESEYYKTKIKNLDLDVFILKDDSPNAFTIPGLDNISLLKTNPMEYQLLGLEVLSRHPLTANLDKGKIVFNSDIKNFKVLVFLNSGLFKAIPNKDYRLAIVLHELGHWVYIQNLISSSKFETMLQIVKPISYTTIAASFIYDTKLLILLFAIIKIILLTVVNVKNRQNEYDADNFVKEMGYGLQLQNALSLLQYKKELNKIDINNKQSFLSDLFDIISLLFTHHSHPPIHKRIFALNESIGMTFFDQLISITQYIDKLISLNNGTICSFI